MLSTYFSNRILNNWLAGQTFATLYPDPLYMGLVNVPCRASDNGLTISEPTDSVYGRQQIGCFQANWYPSQYSGPGGPATGGPTGLWNNSFTINWPINQQVATKSWGVIYQYVLCDARTSGNLLIYDPLDPAVYIDQFDTLELVGYDFKDNKALPATYNSYNSSIDMILGRPNRGGTSNFSNYFRQILGKQILNRNGPLTPLPTTLYLGLLTVEPGPADTGATVTEINTPDYQRASIVQGSNQWSYSTNRYSYNKVPVVFPQPTNDWLGIIWVGIFDSQIIGKGTPPSPSSGNLIYMFRLPRKINIRKNSPPPTFYPGSFFIQLT